MTFVIGSWVLLSILQHCLQSQFVINTIYTFYVCIGNDNFGIRATLRTTIAIAATSVGQITFATINI